MKPTQISQAALEKLKQHEGVRQTAYLDPVGILTVGVGHVVLPGENIKLGQKISMQEVDRLLQSDLQKFYKILDKYVKVPLTQNQFDALVSLTFNIGGGNFSKSTVLRELNKGNYSAAANAFKMWNKAKGKVFPGLVKRRADESSWFNSTTAFVSNNAGNAIGVFLVGLTIFF